MKIVKKRGTNFYLRKYLGVLNFILKIVILLAVLFGIYYFSFKTHFFTISEIHVSGATTFVNESDIKNLAYSNSTGKNLIVYKTSNLEDILTKSFLGAKDIKVVKNFPKSLRIVVTERTPIAIIETAKEPIEYFLVDEDGFVLGIVSPDYANLPRLKYEEEAKVGLFINKDIVPIYLSLTTLLNEQNMQVTSISFNQGTVNFYTSDGAQVLMKFEKIKEDTISALFQLIKQEKLDGKFIKRIDLRYDKVIVSFE